MFDVTPLHEAMAKFLERRGIEKVFEVKGYKEEPFLTGYGCSTCSDVDYKVTIYYETLDDHLHEYVYEGELSTLIRMLTEDD